MVDIGRKLAEIKAIIDYGSYFTINRARQYGKTTTLHQLELMLDNEYIVISISFEGLSEKKFESPEAFCPMFLKKIAKTLEFTSAPKHYAKEWINNNVTDFDLLSEHITEMCRDHKAVLMIDEVDKTSNNQVFLNFLGMLRDKYLEREKGKDHSFHSVILAGVYDIKTIKLKMINEGKCPRAAEENKIYNSPWNIAANFKVDISFSPHEIAAMFGEYEADHNTGMDNRAISDEIYRFTGGYPFLVSRICQAIDEELNKDWTPGGVQKAVQKLLKEQNTLFEDLFKNIKNNKKLADFLYDLLFVGIEKKFNTDNSLVNLGYMYGFFKESDGKVKVANRIFETRIYNYFVSENGDNKEIAKITGVLQQDVVRNGRFDMELCLLKFAEYYVEIFVGCDLKFIEKQGRLLFLLYLQPLINGQGFYHIESQFTDLRRMDIVVDFGRDQFIIELKIWYGNSQHQDAYEQLFGYMESKKALNGYLLTFDFRKEVNKQRRAEWVDFDGGKRIFDVVL
jgi:hypothetical protein